VTDDNETVRTLLAPLEELAARHRIDPETLRSAVDAGAIRPRGPSGDGSVVLAERDVLVWLAGRTRFDES